MWDETRDNPDEDPEDEDPDAPLGPVEIAAANHPLAHITIAKRPHTISNTPDLVVAYNAPDLISAISRFVYQDGESGVNLGHGQYDYDNASLPFEFARLHIWKSFRLHLPPFDEYYPLETVTVCCKPESATSVQMFDPVLVEIDPNAIGLQSKFKFQCLDLQSIQ